MDNDATVLHLFLVNAIAGATVVFLLEAEPGVVEFPRLALHSEEIEDEAALCRSIREATGMEVEISGFLDPPSGAQLHPEGSRVLLARLVSGAPNLKLTHVGWEWTPGAALVRMPFAPKLMVDELKSFMNV